MTLVDFIRENPEVIADLLRKMDNEGWINRSDNPHGEDYEKCLFCGKLHPSQEHDLDCPASQIQQMLCNLD